MGWSELAYTVVEYEMLIPAARVLCVLTCVTSSSLVRRRAEEVAVAPETTMSANERPTRVYSNWSYTLIRKASLAASFAIKSFAVIEVVNTCFSGNFNSTCRILVGSPVGAGVDVGAEEGCPEGVLVGCGTVGRAVGGCAVGTGVGGYMVGI